MCCMCPGRDRESVEMVESYLRAAGMFRDYTQHTQDPTFSQVRGHLLTEDILTQIYTAHCPYCVCMYSILCTHLFMCTCVCVHRHVCELVHVYTCTCIYNVHVHCMYTCHCVCLCVFVCMHDVHGHHSTENCKIVPCIRTCTSIYMYTNMYTYMYTRTCTTYMYMYMYVYMQYVCVTVHWTCYIQMYMYIYVHVRCIYMFLYYI